MFIEHERTFLAKQLPEDLKKHPSVEMLDLYLPTTARHPLLRLRQKGEKYEVTKKVPSGKDFSVLHEFTTPLSKAEFDELAASVKGKRVHKRRYEYSWNNHVCEIDVFLDSLQGLVLVDVEFEEGKGKAEFVAPEFCLVDVTGEEFVAGGYLAGKTYGEIANDLERYKYKPLNNNVQK
jgi:CYTH domain-containing protein